MGLLARRGFQFAETMSGTYALTAKPDDHRRMSFSVVAQADSVFAHLRDGKATLRGTLDMDGFADGVPVEGTIFIKPLTQKVIRYELHFTANDGQRYRLAGQKDIKFGDIKRTMTELPATVFDAAGVPVASSITRFDASADMFQFLASFRPA